MSETSELKLGESNVELMGTHFEFLECTPDRHPLGLRVDFTRPGELAPVRSGFMPPGSAILFLTPAVAQQFKAVAKRKT